MKRTSAAVLVLILALLALSGKASATQPFQPSYDLVSISDSAPGANGSVVQHIGVPQGDHVIGYLKLSLPINWDVALAQQGDPDTDKPIVGSGTLQVDVDLSPGGLPCDGVPESYPLTIYDEGRLSGDPPEVETNWFALGYDFQQFTFVVKGSAPAGQTIEAFMFVAPPEVCTLMSLDLTFQGTSSDNPATTGTNEAGRTVLTNPASAAVYTWSAQVKSKPLGPGEHIVNRCDQIGIGATATDTDGDFITDSCDNCPSTGNADQRDIDLDTLGDACDPDDDQDGVCDVGGPLPDGTPGTPAGGCAAGLSGSDSCASTVPPADGNGCSQAQVDQDLDGICDPGKSSPTLCTGSDNCPAAPNPGQEDFNNNGIGDACEDSDADGIVDALDNCRTVANTGQQDGDTDGVGDACDNCVSTPNADQTNTDAALAAAGASVTGDALGDACDDDDDNDSLGLGSPLYFRDSMEAALGTDPLDNCNATSTPNDEPVDASGTDFNDSRREDGIDVFLLAQRFGSTTTVTPSGKLPYAARYDLNADSAINGLDVYILSVYFNKTCL